MSIKDFSEKIKDLAHFQALGPRALTDDLFLGLIIVLVAIGAFGLGRISKIEGSRMPIRIENGPSQNNDTFAVPRTETGNQKASAFGSSQTDSDLVASKSGKKYYYPWCAGVQKIAPANLIHFASRTEAEARGYTPSNTCKGL